MRLDLHVHTSFSDGLNTVKEVIEQAKRIGLDGIAVTDHNEVRGSRKAIEHASSGFKVIPGVEISAIEGHILCLGTIGLPERFFVGRYKSDRDIVKQSAREVIDSIHSAGGLAIAAHPYDLYRSGVGDLVYKLDFDAIEVVNSHTFGNRRDPVKVARELGLPMVGGSDAHTIKEIGNVVTELGNRPLEDIKAGKTKIIERPKTKWLASHIDYLVRKYL